MPDPAYNSGASEVVLTCVECDIEVRLPGELYLEEAKKLGWTGILKDDTDWGPDDVGVWWTHVGYCPEHSEA